MYCVFCRIPSIKDNEWNIFDKTEEESEVWLSIGAEQKMNSSGVHAHRLHLWTELYKNHFIENGALDLSHCRYLMFLASFVLFIFKIS